MSILIKGMEMPESCNKVQCWLDWLRQEVNQNEGSDILNA